MALPGFERNFGLKGQEWDASKKAWVPVGSVAAPQAADKKGAKKGAKKDAKKDAKKGATPTGDKKK